MPTLALAQEAPPGDASGVAAGIEGVIAIGATEAEAGGGENEASAHALELGGEPVSEQFGGSQKGPGESNGALLDTEETELGRIEVTPWSASADEGSAVGRAALARLKVAELASVDVLQSESSATHRGSSSTGAASSDGAVVNVGGEEGLTIVALHAETSSDGESGSYLLAINEQPIGTSEESDGACLIEVPELVKITCLTATGGTAGEEASPVEAAVLDAVVGGANGLAAQVVGSSSSGGPGTGTAAAGEPPQGGELPATGLASGLIAAISLGLLASAGLLERLRRLLSNPAA